MRKYLFLFAAMTVSIAFFSCNNANTTCEFYFQTSESTASEEWTLWIDGQNKGVLPNPELDTTCENANGALDSLIHLTLDATRHTFEAVDNSGVIRSKGYFKTNENQSKVGGSTGGASTGGSCDCTIFTIFD